MWRSKKLNYIMSGRRAQGLRLRIMQKYIVLSFLEPLGSTPPKFSTSAHSQAFIKDDGTSFALLCSAQGSPTPLITRSVNSL